MILKSTLVLLLVLFASFANADAKPARDSTRGELLYTTHCIACHSERVHWRDAKLVADWASLEVQVRRWQEVQALNWSKRDITEVARYLDDLYYHFAKPV
jgi:mono/diheme cytochrome c family protein